MTEAKCRATSVAKTGPKVLTKASLLSLFQFWGLSRPIELEQNRIAFKSPTGATKHKVKVPLKLQYSSYIFPGVLTLTIMRCVDVAVLVQKMQIDSEHLPEYQDEK